MLYVLIPEWCSQVGYCCIPLGLLNGVNSWPDSRFAYSVSYEGEPSPDMHKSRHTQLTLEIYVMLQFHMKKGRIISKTRDFEAWGLPSICAQNRGPNFESQSWSKSPRPKNQIQYASSYTFEGMTPDLSIFGHARMQGHMKSLVPSTGQFWGPVNALR